MSHLHDTHAPSPDMDVLAARLAEQRYRTLVDRGVSTVQAWDEAVALFAGHHPSWPVPLAEREAARTVGALVLNRMAVELAQPRASMNKVPFDLLVDLATLETPESMRAAMRVEEMGDGAAAVFRGAWKFTGNVRPVTSRPPPSRPSTTRTALHA
ncbi:hypothetical protein [Muricoccus vinaceus]|uniref:DUF222 domain-containing protein n=1 Tax=Muricoccus vinaceus TaxID=424704 RepID=A0ABV6IW51_9PROT